MVPERVSLSTDNHACVLVCGVTELVTAALTGNYCPNAVISQQRSLSIGESYRRTGFEAITERNIIIKA